MIITTTKGDMDDSLFDKRTGIIDNETENTQWVEYWQNGNIKCSHSSGINPDLKCPNCGAEQVHRSVSMVLKKAATFSEAKAAEFK